VSILENIQMLCEKNKITVPILERELKLGNGSIYKWNKSSPKVDTLQKVANYFSVTIDSLIAKTFFIEDIKDADGKIREANFNPKGDPYILLSEKAREKGMPPDILEKLIEFYTK
jgi:transcriptional regulator with XRE-family HTH domain